MSAVIPVKTGIQRLNIGAQETASLFFNEGAKNVFMDNEI